MSRSFRHTLQEGSNFFMKRGKVHEALERVTHRLEQEGIAYAVIGGVALAAHGFDRFTSDLDLLPPHERLDALHEKLVGRRYVPSFLGGRKTLPDTPARVKIQFIT